MSTAPKSSASFRLGCLLLSLALCAPMAAAARAEEEPACVDRGEASWYGPGLEGKETASGETFDADEMTAAHPTLPLGTNVEVTNVETGETVEVEINDRGPHADDRVIDLSKAAAEELGIKKEGVAEVEVEASPEDQPDPEVREELIEHAEDQPPPPAAAEAPPC
jgi:rare lipoprotein A (peptidoglycan hydrolase)